MHQSVIFWNIFARKYSKKPISDLDAYEVKLDLTQKYLKTEYKVLEVGCGTGSTAMMHAPFVAEYTGIDYSSKMIEICEEKLRESILTNMDFQVATIGDFQNQDHRYNVILALNYLHLNKDINLVIQQIKNLLVEDGVLIINTPCYGKASPKRLFFNILSRFKVFPFINFFTRKHLDKMLKKNGLEVVEDHRPGKDKSIHFIIVKRAR